MHCNYCDCINFFFKEIVKISTHSFFTNYLNSTYLTMSSCFKVINVISQIYKKEISILISILSIHIIYFYLHSYTCKIYTVLLQVNLSCKIVPTLTLMVPNKDLLKSDSIQ